MPVRRYRGIGKQRGEGALAQFARLYLGSACTSLLRSSCYILLNSKLYVRIVKTQASHLQQKYATLSPYSAQWSPFIFHNTLF